MLSVGVIGLGYVGLPLAVALAKNRSVKGFDISKQKIDSISQGTDPNDELDTSAFQGISLDVSDDINHLKDCNFYIVAVPTPITKHKAPDLTPLRSATENIATILKKGDIIVFESTVFPGCTEEVCIPILESVSGLRYMTDFKVGYSPERINPGDKVHTLENTIKIVSGCDEPTLDTIDTLYSEVVTAGVYRANNIKVAEAAKIVENVQRDLNIALMNELSLIFDRMGINTKDVIDAAATKWNFMKLYPGLVGGHCISVDPYYLTYKAIELGYYPEVILSGRKVNDKVSNNVAKKVVKHISRQGIKLNDARVLVMGIAFKENVSDFRNSKVVDLIKDLQDYEINVDIEDPYVKPAEIKERHDLEINKPRQSNYNAIIVAVGHQQYTGFDEAYFQELGDENVLIVDIKSLYINALPSLNYWTL